MNDTTCNHCHGHGGRTFKDDPSPPGIPLPPGYYLITELCPECLEENKCPLCGREGTIEEDALGNEYCATDDCTWNWDDYALGPNQ